MIAVAAVWVIFSWVRRPEPLRWVSRLLVADLVVFLVFCSTGLFAGYDVMPSGASARAALGDQGRTALVDVVGEHSREFEALGEANMNVFTRLPSVQGYGSLISTIYDNSTGTHPQEQVNPCEIVRGTFTQLRLSAMAVTSSDLRDAAGDHLRRAGVLPAPATGVGHLPLLRPGPARRS